LPSIWTSTMSVGARDQRSQCVLSEGAATLRSADTISINQKHASAAFGRNPKPFKRIRCGCECPKSA
jgi:hypothetical protein